MTDTPQPPSPVKITTPPSPADSNGLAIASLVFGVMSLLGFLIFAGVPAIITGIMSLKLNQKNRGMSIAGIILGSIATLLSLLFVLIVVLIVVFGPQISPVPQTDGASYDQDTSVPIESSRT